MGYTKLFSDILMSTVWREPNHVRILWITMLASQDRDHIVNASIPGLADSARISIDECEHALQILSSPDYYSRTKDHKGRRIIVVDGGWKLVNGKKYHDKLNAQERREYKRNKAQEARDRKNAPVGEAQKDDAPKKGNEILRVTDVDKADTDKIPDTRYQIPVDQENSALSNAPLANSKPESYVSQRKRKLTGLTLLRFNDFWITFNWKKGKAKAADAWLDIDGMNDELFITIMQAARNEAAARAGLLRSGNTPKWGQGWLNAKRWEDEFNIGENNLDHSNSAVEKVRRANDLDHEERINSLTGSDARLSDITADVERVTDSQTLDEDGNDLWPPMDHEFRSP